MTAPMPGSWDTTESAPQPRDFKRVEMDVALWDRSFMLWLVRFPPLDTIADAINSYLDHSRRFFNSGGREARLADSFGFELWRGARAWSRVIWLFREERWLLKGAEAFRVKVTNSGTELDVTLSLRCPVFDLLVSDIRDRIQGALQADAQEPIHDPLHLSPDLRDWLQTESDELHEILADTAWYRRSRLKYHLPKHEVRRIARKRLEIVEDLMTSDEPMVRLAGSRALKPGWEIRIQDDYIPSSLDQRHLERFHPRR